MKKLVSAAQGLLIRNEILQRKIQEGEFPDRMKTVRFVCVVAGYDIVDLAETPLAHNDLALIDACVGEEFFKYYAEVI